VIGRTFPFGKGFLGLARYLEHGEAGEHRDRVLWVESRNLPTEDPETAARLMAAHARLSVRTQRPVYHFVIAFDPGDPVDRESMRRVADAVLRKLGLEEHQALIVAHNDTEHPHMHLVVNRVHPVKHVAWENSWDWPKIEQELRVQEVELGMRRVPGHHGRVPGREPAPALERGDAAFLRFVQERAGPVMERAQSWAEVEQGLAATGLRVRVKGGGLTIHDGRQEVKASDVDRAFSRGKMEQRFGKWSARRSEQMREPGPVLGRTGTPAQEPERAPEQDPEPEQTVARVQPPEPPQPVPTAPPLAAPEPPVRRRPPPAQEAAPAPPSGEEFTWVLAREADRLQLRHEAELLQHGAGLIREARAAKDRAKVRSERERASHDAADKLAHLEARERQAVEAVDVLREKLRPVFADIAAAAGEMDRFEREHGMDKLRGMLEDRPETFGALVRQDWPFKLGWSTNKAAKRAKDVADDVENAIRAHRARPRKAELEAARKHVEAAGAALVQTIEAARDLPGPTTLEHRAAEAFRPLMRAGRSVAWLSHQLARLLPPEDREAAAIADNVLRVVERSIAHERDRSIRRGGLER
jgi:hypothetical protein